MVERYALTPNQVAALRALNERIVEASPPEIAVSARLLPNEARAALTGLEHLSLVNSWIPVTGRTGEQLFVLTDEGQTVCRALAELKGTLPAGTVVRLPRLFPSFVEWHSRRTPSYVEIVPDDNGG